MTRLDALRWKARAGDLYDALVEVVNAGGLNQLPVGLVTRTFDELTAYAVDCHIDESPTPEQETDHEDQ
jgi:hypothetical protein